MGIKRVNLYDVLGIAPGTGKSYVSHCYNIITVLSMNSEIPGKYHAILLLIQHHSSKVSILQHSAFFTVQLSHPYMITGKTIALTRRTVVGKVMSPLLNMLSRLVITFLPRSKRLFPTLCDPIDGSPPGSSVPGILQARTLE